MDALLIKTGGLLLIVALGYLLKRRGVFQQGDARLLSRIIVNLTLPGALLSSFSAFRLVPSLLAVLAAAAAANVLLLAVSALVTRRRPGPVRALYLLNAPSYNIGTFVLPFVQSFLPPDMLLAVSMFDAGNSPFNCGGAYALTAALTGGERLTVCSVLGRMLRSVPFDTFLAILLLGAARPAPAAAGLHRGGDVRSGQRLSGDADDRIAAGAADSAGEPVRRSAGGSAALRIRPGGLRRLLDAAAACRDPAGAGAEPSGAGALCLPGLL